MPNLEAYVTCVLDKTRLFLKSLEFKQGKKYPKFVVIYGSHWPTIESFYARKNNNETIELVWPNSFTRGDGIVPEKSSNMPNGYEYEKLNSVIMHPFMMNDVGSIWKALKRLNE